jgi:hypothetical protein
MLIELEEGHQRLLLLQLHHLVLALVPALFELLNFQLKKRP